MVFLIVILAFAVFFDLRERRIPNQLVLVGLAAGVATAVMAGGVAALPGSLAGLAVGGGVFLPFFALRLLGAGDVKLMAVVGGFAGLDGIWPVLLYTVLAGGLLGVAVVLASGRTKAFFSSLADGWASLRFLKMTNELPLSNMDDRRVPRIPYAVAIAAGSIAWMLNHS